MTSQLQQLREKYPGGIVVTGWWCGEPVWRHRTAYDSINDIVSNEVNQVLIVLSGERIQELEGMKKQKPKTKCSNLENHLHGSCFECKKIDGYNEALDTLVEKEKELLKKLLEELKNL